ncbi:MAG: dTDP-4-dehydrorhamnose reductase [Pseudomonadota bacterium]
MSLLLTGAYGQLGKEIIRQAPGAGISVIATDIDTVDITDADAVAGLMDLHRPRICVNAAAYTQVDRAETQPDAAFAVNRDGPLILARHCRRVGIPLIHISTDFVFDGTLGRPYEETDTPCPVSVYGGSKAAGDAAVQETLPEHIILRTAWLYGTDGPSFVHTMLRLAGEKERLAVVDDQVGSPTAAENLARAVITLAGRHLAGRSSMPWGIFNMTDGGAVSWCEFARTIIASAARLGMVKNIPVDPISTAEFGAPARRPAYSVLNCRRITEVYGIGQEPWETALERTLSRIAANGAAPP